MFIYNNQLKNINYIVSKNISFKFIHNQSYIHLNKKYTQIKLDYDNLLQIQKDNKKLIKELHTKLVQLEFQNNTLLEKNKNLSLELHQKTIFYNLNLYK